MKKALNILIVGFFLLSIFKLSIASENGHPLADIELSQDEDTLKRGVMVYYNSCRMCHSMKYIRYQDLSDIGFSNTNINNLRGDYQLSDTFSSTSSDEAMTQLYGLVPPDLSVMAKARKQGPQYIYTLLTSYYETSENVYDNKLFPGIKMPDVFSHSIALNVEEKIKIESKIRDVTEFLLWASDPKAKERKTLGKYVIAYLIVLSLMFYVVMKRVWRRLDDV